MCLNLFCIQELVGAILINNTSQVDKHKDIEPGLP